DGLTGTRLQPVMVLHSNHPSELTADFCAAMQQLRVRKMTLLNQSVLLAGVNDNADVLIRLSEALFVAGILPYYLHLPDRVRGTHHFDVSRARAAELHTVLSAHLPGYLVPRLVTEIPGQSSKTQVQEQLCTGQS